jgi:hypothetical protein
MGGAFSEISSESIGAVVILAIARLAMPYIVKTMKTALVCA